MAGKTRSGQRQTSTRVTGRAHRGAQGHDGDAASVVRLGRLNRALWRELVAGAGRLCDTLDEAPELGRWRAQVRLLRATLVEFEPEFEQFVHWRTRGVPGRALDRSDELFRVLDVLEQTVETLLAGIESDRGDVEEFVVAFLGESLESGVGRGFLSALGRFHGAFRDWCVAWRMLDAGKDDDGSESGRFEAARLDQIEARLADRETEIG